MNRLTATITALMITAAPSALAHGDPKHAVAKKREILIEEKAFGREGDPAKANRTINIDMNDRMRFSPDTITVKQGETIKFVVKNSGKVMHEFVLGTIKELKEHAEIMKKHPGMEHDGPYMAHVPPGKTGTITWQFSRAGDFNFACLIAGHSEAGMIGKINVARR